MFTWVPRVWSHQKILSHFGLEKFSYVLDNFHLTIFLFAFVGTSKNRCWINQLSSVSLCILTLLYLLLFFFLGGLHDFIFQIYFFKKSLSGL